jgi:hypothetical protein
MKIAAGFRQATLLNSIMRALNYLLLACYMVLNPAASSLAASTDHVAHELRDPLVSSISNRPAFTRDSRPWKRPSEVTDRAHSCSAAIAVAERRYGLPTGLLRAIGDVESGRALSEGKQIQPWPWTVNAQGEGRFFDSMLQATSWVRQQQSAGVQSIDVGCLQVNLLYHPQAFRSLEEALDPRANSDYAARFLLSLYNMTRSWATAVGYYHSQTNALAQPYRQRVQSAFSAGLASRCSANWSALQMAWQATLPRPAPKFLTNLSSNRNQSDLQGLKLAESCGVDIGPILNLAALRNETRRPGAGFRLPIAYPCVRQRQASHPPYSCADR